MQLGPAGLPLSPGLRATSGAGHGLLHVLVTQQARQVEQRLGELRPGDSQRSGQMLQKRFGPHLSAHWQDLLPQRPCGVRRNVRQVGGVHKVVGERDAGLQVPDRVDAPAWIEADVALFLNAPVQPCLAGFWPLGEKLRVEKVRKRVRVRIRVLASVAVRRTAGAGGQQIVVLARRTNPLLPARGTPQPRAREVCVDVGGRGRPLGTDVQPPHVDGRVAQHDVRAEKIRCSFEELGDGKVLCKPLGAAPHVRPGVQVERFAGIGANRAQRLADCRLDLSLRPGGTRAARDLPVLVHALVVQKVHRGGPLGERGPVFTQVCDQARLPWQSIRLEEVLILKRLAVNHGKR
mmetsp:Transcript_1504/g.5643  ORF Transcript_1504/g.5643 Transcript_1504/m.5643 type:complete len:348 (-) Transcript_1504:180-1223(-)